MSESILKKYHKGLDEKNKVILDEVLHDNFKFIMHASGKELSKSELIEWAMSGDVMREKVRIIYENDEIGVEHSFVEFKSDGNKQAVLAVFKYDAHQIISLETGATNISK